MNGHLAAWSYFQNINTASISPFKKEFDPDCVTDDPIVSAYTQVYWWKLAVEKAGSFEVDKVRDAFRSKIEFNAPGYLIDIDPKTHHAYKTVSSVAFGKIVSLMLFSNHLTLSILIRNSLFPDGVAIGLMAELPGVPM